MSSIRQLTTIYAGCILLSTAACTSQTHQPVPLATNTANTTEPTDKNATTNTAGPDQGAADVSAGGNKAMVAADFGWKTAVEPKALSKNVDAGLRWLVSHQQNNGGWGQGDESPQMRGSSQANVAHTANVADTAMAVMALMRSGSTPSQGPYKDSIDKGLGFILSEIEHSDDDSLYITQIRGTRVQSKIGTYVDTFTALVVLTEAKGKMPSAGENERLEKLLNKVLAKIEKNQRSDGTWDNNGWAPVLSQSMAAKGLNRAAQAGADVDEATLVRVEKQAQQQFDSSSGSFGGGGSAGVELYSGAANSSSLRDSVNTRKTKKRSLEVQAKTAAKAEDRAAATRALEESRAAEQATESAQTALLRRLEDPNFIRGFGNNGGEEFLSYMLVSESLVVEGGEDWKSWDANITKLVNGVQNGDGSWTGHHCITGRTFCTAAALLVLMADRTPVPIAAQLKKGR